MQTHRTLASIALLASLVPSAAHAYHMEDTLRGSTMGNQVGGTFDTEGWHVTDRTNRIWYALPRLVSGSIEFTLSNVSGTNLGSNETELFAMYEGGYGITEPIVYAPYFRVNHYKCMLRIYGNAETGREGQQKLMWGMCPGGAPGYDTCACGTSFFEEPFGGNGTWDGTPQRIRIEWGDGVTRYLRNGGEVLRIDWASTGLTFGPSELHMSLGTSRPDAVDYAQLPVGAIFSDLVVDGTEGDLAVCPGATAPDAGTETDTGPLPDAGAGLMVVDYPAIEDVTVDPSHATTVYPDPLDLGVAVNDSEFYLKFRIDSLPGRVVHAQVLLNSQTNPSAVGDGASLFTASRSTWSETTLTWNDRPGGTGARLARIDGVTVDEQYTFDLPTGTIAAPGTYAFAVLPETTDLNTAHFDSKEVSPARGPHLRLVIDPSMSPVVDAGTADAAMTTDSGGFPDAGSVDASMDATPTDARHDARADGSVGPEPGGGCACRAGMPVSESGRAWFAVAMAMAAWVAARRRRYSRIEFEVLPPFVLSKPQRGTSAAVSKDGECSLRPSTPLLSPARATCSGRTVDG